MALIDMFTTNYFRILSLMYDYQITVSGKKFVPITQVEISSKLDISKVTINIMMKELIKNGYIIKEEGRIGKYYLTKKSEELVEGIKKLQ